MHDVSLRVRRTTADAARLAANLAQLTGCEVTVEAVAPSPVEWCPRCVARPPIRGRNFCAPCSEHAAVVAGCSS